MTLIAQLLAITKGIKVQLLFVEIESMIHTNNAVDKPIGRLLFKITFLFLKIILKIIKKNIKVPIKPKLTSKEKISVVDR